MQSILVPRNLAVFGALLLATILIGCDSKDEGKAKKAAPDAQSKAAPAAPPKAEPVAPPPVATAPKPAPAAPPPPAAVAPPPPVVVAPPPPVVITPKPDRGPKPQPQPERRADRWELLGERQADLKLDRDRIAVGRSEGRFRELQLTVRGAPLEIYDMVVTFANGRQYKPAMKLYFDERTASRVIDLPGDRQVIRHVDFLYRSANRREGRATITLYGR